MSNAEPQTIYLGLGSNLGDARAQFDAACQELAPVFTVSARSSLYHTRPFGFTDQANFTNAVIAGTSQLPPLELLAAMQAAERCLGKRFVRPNGPRCIDLDLLFYGQTVLHAEGVHIPHARAHERDFVLLPLAEISPAFRHPASGKSITHLLSQLHEHYFTGERHPWPATEL